MANTAVPTWNELLNLHPDFRCFDQPELQGFLDSAGCRVDECYFGGLYHDAYLYMAGHLAAQQLMLNQNISDLSATSLFVNKKKAGDMWIEFDGTRLDSVPSDFAGTLFGVRYWGLVRARRFMASPQVL